MRALLTDRDARVRATAAFALAWLTDPRGVSSRAIAARCGVERDTPARASMLIALGHLGVATHRTLLERLLADGSADLLVRSAAAIGLVYLGGDAVTSVARPVLVQASTTKALRRTAQPWNDGDLAGHAGIVLARLPVLRADLGGTFERLASLGYIAGDEVAGQLVKKAFAGREARRAADLTDRQRALLVAIVRSGLLRYKGHVDHWLRLRGLPGVAELPRFVGLAPGTHPELRSRRPG